jgi:hypothetical protein
MLLAVLLTAIGAGVITIAILASIVQKQGETIKGLRAQIDGIIATHPLRYYASHGGNIPIVTSSRRSQMGSGYVLTIGNQCTDSLPLVVALENPEANRRKTVNIALEPGGNSEFSHFDDWKLSKGDIVEISHEGFNSVTMRFR